MRNKAKCSIRPVIFAGALLLQCGAFSFNSRAAAGDLDLSFDPGSGVNGAVKAAALQPDGKVIIGGEFTTVKGLARFGIARLNADGSGDATFDAGTNADQHIGAIAVLPDGKLVFTRDFYNFSGAPPGHKVARLNSDGTLDASFVADIGTVPPSSGFTCLAVQTDGKLVLGGYFNHFLDGVGFVRRLLLVRLHENGTSDTGFARDHAIFGGPLSSLAVQPDGKILIAGDISTAINGTNYDGVARLNPGGTVDTSFIPRADGYIRCLGLQPDGKILLGGSLIGNGTNRNVIARLDANGNLDGSFQPETDLQGVLSSFVVQADGKIAGIGANLSVSGNNRQLVRFNMNGSVDAAFNSTIGAPDNSGGIIALQPDGRLFIGGAFTLVNSTNRERIARLNSDGGLDDNFNPGSSINAGVNSLVTQAGGRALIGGDFTIAGGASRNRVARLNGDGSIDGSFDPGAGISAPFYKLEITSVLGQADGKVFIGGDFTAVNGTNRNFVARLNADGTLDGSYVPALGALGSPRIAALQLQPDGKLLVGGKLFNGTNANGVARLNLDGSLDTGFAPDTFGLTGSDYTEINSLVVQPDGKILAGGGFVDVVGDAYPEFLLTRLNADGSADSQFTPVTNAPGGNTYANIVSSIVLQPDGRILAATFSYYGAAAGVWRFNTNGSVDNAFAFGLAADGAIHSIALQEDGRILIAGDFTKIQGTNRNRIARLNADGSLDPGFNPGGEVNGVMRSLALQPDGKALVGGSFRSIYGVLRPHVARIHGDFVTPALRIVRSDAFMSISWPVTTLNFQLQESTNLSLANAWSHVAQSRLTNDLQISVIVPGTERKFFRLKSP